MAKYYFRRLIFFGTLIAIIIITISIFTSDAIPLWLETHTFQEGIRTVDGRPVSNVEQITDQSVVVVIYWSVRCKYCHKQLKELNEISDNVVAINVRDSESSVRKYIQENKLKMQVLIGMPQPPSTGLPHTQLLVRTETGWRLVEEWMGYVSLNKIMEWLE